MAGLVCWGHLVVARSCCMHRKMHGMSSIIAYQQPFWVCNALHNVFWCLHVYGLWASSNAQAPESLLGMQFWENLLMPELLEQVLGSCSWMDKPGCHHLQCVFLPSVTLIAPSSHYFVQLWCSAIFVDFLFCAERMPEKVLWVLSSRRVLLKLLQVHGVQKLWGELVKEEAAICIAGTFDFCWNIWLLVRSNNDMGCACREMCSLLTEGAQWL